MTFEREKQRISAAEILEQIAVGRDIKLHRCTVPGDLDINRLLAHKEKFDTTALTLEQAGTTKTLIISGSLVFDSCTFEDTVSFAPPWSDPQALSVVFKQDVTFNSSTLAGQTLFSNALFHGHAGFDGCTFQRVASFRHTAFASRAMFRTALFNGYCLLNDADFRGDARFSNTHFAKGVNLTSVTFHSTADFAGTYSASRMPPTCEGVRFQTRNRGNDETFWRFVKRTAQESGHYQLAGEAFFNERCAHFRAKIRGPDYARLTPGRKLLRLLLGIRLVPELVFGRYLFGYGERPVRVLLASLLVILLCALYYTFHGSLLYHGSPAGTSFLQSLYFSTITFTTLGLGDLHPEPGHFTRYVAMSEALTGACLMALFVVSLAKRYSRG